MVNPFSGTCDKEKLKIRIEKKTLLFHIPFEIEDTDPTGHYDFLPQKIAAEKFTDVVICGGDGTVNQVVSHLLHTKIRIGIIPVGSGNGLALAAGISLNLKKALNIVFQNKTGKIDGFMVNEQFGFMLTGLGFDARVAWAFSKQKKRGLIGYLKICFKEFFKKESYLIKMKTDGKIIAERIFFISIANSNQFGNRVTIAPKASLTDGLLDVVVVTKMNPFLSGIHLLRQILNGSVQPSDSAQQSKNKILYLQTSELEIENVELAPLHIDGEPKKTSGKINIKLIPESFELLVP